MYHLLLLCKPLSKLINGCSRAATSASLSADGVNGSRRKKVISKYGRPII
jgi:hypothetical protein